jgi:hypothetical protein
VTRDFGEPFTLFEFSNPSDTGWFGVVDKTPGAVVGVDNPETPEIDHNPVVEEIANVRERGPQEPGRCGDTTSGVFRARGFSDWGAFFGDYYTVGRAIVPADEGYEGVSFWARTTARSDRSFFLVVDNAHTAQVVEDEPQSEAADQAATDADAGAPENTSPNLCFAERVDDAGVSHGFPPEAKPSETCDNPYMHAVTTSEHWQFFTLPFSDFIQDRARPNVRRDGFDPTVQLVRFTIRFPVETDIELYLDNLGLYRRFEP